MLLTRATVYLLVISLVLPMTTSVFAQPIEAVRTLDSTPDFVRYVNHLKTDVSTGRLSASDADQKLQVYFTQLTLEGKDVLSEVIASLRLHADLPGSAILVERFEKAQKDLNRLKAKMESESQSTMSPEERLAFQRRWENAFISVLKPLQKDIERFSQTGSRFDDFFWLCAGVIGVPAIVGIVIGLIMYSSRQAHLGEKVETATRKPLQLRDKNLAQVQTTYDQAVSQIRTSQETSNAEKTKLQADILQASELKQQGAQTIVVGGVPVQIDNYLQTKQSQLNQVELAIQSSDSQIIAAFDQYQKGLADTEVQYQKDLSVVSIEVAQANKEARFWSAFGEGAGGGAVIGLFLGLAATCFSADGY